MDETDILIVGGGFTGCALACALADGKRRILVLEARRAPGTRFAGELIHPTGVDELDRLGLLQPLFDAGAVAVQGFAVFPRPGHRETLLPYGAVRGARPYGLGIEHHRMVAVMRAQAEARPGVTFLYGHRVAHLTGDAGGITGARTDDGQSFAARLTVCADGRHSRLRPQRARTQLVSFTAALRVPGARLPHPGHGHIFLGAWGPILAYPIARDEARLCFDLPVGVSRDEALDRLRVSYTHLLPFALRASVEQALSSEPLELVANHAMRVSTVTAPGLALVGDAGGCSHPLTAAGMTVCLNDVRLLAGSFDPHGALRRSHYAAQRQPFARSRALLTRSLYRVFRGPDPVTRALRDGVFRYWRNPDARAASTALLSGADASLGGFWKELSKVALSAVRA